MLAFNANGNMTCRQEGVNVYDQHYNAENRLYLVQAVDGTCAAPGATITSVWEFTYDGDGTLVAQVYSAGGDTTGTYYYRGRSYQVTKVGEDETITRYYAFGGTTVAMVKCTNG